MTAVVKERWKKVRLGEVCEKVNYGYTASAEYSRVGPKFLRITDIVLENINWDKVPYCQIEEKNIPKFLLKEGDIVIARTGATVGYAKYIKKGIPTAVFASYLVRIRLKKDCAARYIGFLIESDIYKRFIKANISGAAQPQANAQVLTSYPTPIAPLNVQRKIAAILSAYDDLIENNTLRIQILEEMAQTFYKEWFVKFRFPGYEKVKMVDSELGKIPEGWEVKKVKDIVKRLKAGKTYTQKGVMATGSVPVIDQSRSEFLGFHNNESDHYTSSEEPIIIFGDHTCKMQIMVEPFSLGPNVIPFISNDNGLIYYLFFLIHNLVETREYKRHWNELVIKKVALADKKSQIFFSEMVKPITEEIDLLRKRILTLRRTCDLLLPKLISEEIDVEDLDINTEELEQ